MGKSKIEKSCIYYVPISSLDVKDWCSNKECKCELGSVFCKFTHKLNSENLDGAENDKVVEGEIVHDNLEDLRDRTTLSDKGQYTKSGYGQNRNLDVKVEVDNEWLPKMLNLEGAGEKYKNIGVSELKFIVGLIKYNNNIIAYKEAYDTTNLSSDYIEQRASDLKRRIDIADLLAILRERMVRQTETQLRWQFSDSVDNLKFLIDTAKEEIQNCRDDGKTSYLTLTRVTAIKDAVKELNQMMGYTEKSVKINNSVTIIGKEEDLPN